MVGSNDLNTKYLELNNTYNFERQNLEKYESTRNVLYKTIIKNKQDIELIKDLIEQNDINSNLETNKKYSKYFAVLLIICGLGMTIVDLNVAGFNLFRDLIITLISTGAITATTYQVIKNKIIKQHDFNKEKSLKLELTEAEKIREQLNSYSYNISYLVSNTNSKLIELASEMRKIVNELDQMDDIEKTDIISYEKTYQKKKEK